MTIRIALLVFFIVNSFNFFSNTIVDSTHQSDTIELKPNQLYLELGGPTGIYGLNYERTVYKLDKFSFKARATFSTLTVNPELGLDYWVGLGATISYQAAKKSIVEFGGGQMYFRYKVLDFFEAEGQKVEFEYYTYFTLGYKHILSSKGWFVKGSYTPVILYNEPEFEGAAFQSWGGISIGKHF